MSKGASGVPGSGPSPDAGSISRDSTETTGAVPRAERDVELPAAIAAELLRALTGSRDDRAERIENLCRRHPEHADRVREQAAHHEQAAKLLRRPAGRLPEVGEYVGRYRILDLLGEGGMGRVYLAEERGPVVRRVALKLIQLGLDTERVLARFEAERQALALMEHDNIARVLDGGANERGFAYFVMEYVKGVPITEYWDDNRLPLEARLQLFRAVCSGVQHAHQKGVIHRDLKPSNVLVTVQGGEPVPKIIDFGLARATDHRLVQQTIYTEQNRLIGTPAYMSPEQAGLSRLDIDTRTDVYALGVLLYELLTGELPFLRHELEGCDLAEMQRKIREDDPPRPSTRVSSLDTSERNAGLRRTDAQSLARTLRGDLDWITMKALEKDRTRRYGTAEALADDIARHLRHEPVEAGPPSAGYRLRKLVRRHRGRFAAAALIFVILVAGALATTILAVEKARLVADYRTLRGGAGLDALEHRADVAHPAAPEMAGELAELVRLAEELVARTPEIESDLERVRSGFLIDPPGVRSIRRGLHPESALVEAWREEARHLEEQKQDDRLLPEHLAAADAEIRALRDAVAAAERRISLSNRVAIPDRDRQFIHDRIEEQLARLRFVQDQLLPDLRWRHHWAGRVRAETVGRFAEEWRLAGEAIHASARYAGLGRLEPQVGLVPLGPDPRSGLWEFADLASGAAPRRGADGVLEVGIEHGIVFVLIPPGAVRFGFDDEVDPAGSDKYPEQQVGAIFLARHEMSRAQWMRLAREIRGLRLQDGGIIDLRNRSGDERGKPANGVTWHMCHALLRRHGLDLPTEIEWEYACKAGTTTRWNTGSHPRSLVGAANFGDPFPDAWRPQSLAPVFADLRQNDFGLLQMHGNVSEWCKDVAPPYPDTLRAIRGGSWLGDPMAGLSTFRNRATPSNAAREVGLRPARRIQRGG